MSARRRAVLDAAIAVLGREGPRGLTHRATDREAGLPEGSAANLFGRRSELLEGIVERMRQVERERWARLLPEQEPKTARELATSLVGLIQAGTGASEMETVRARLYLHLESPEAIAADNRGVTDEIAERVAAVGGDPAQVEILLSTVDGLALRAVTVGPGSLPNQATMVEALLRIMRVDADGKA
ncbi:hypothetical protein EV191_1011506 [Tamaricihabitans halophyticus]|uniref:HTH tetR-type domain-containing protein n=1 Tax=Tamaricihabitans halophyticus TaxID=1262583 RepID=A0A4R2R6Q8_9PSEU|nr:TetR/AcrR family transcriptional regulator [Tamaricihabitans halophyticus]TCP57549.1 hypothetical protein EV191_1011506 [Tamaricihabitans halophyticus]